MRDSPIVSATVPDRAAGLRRNVRIFGLTSFLNDTATEMAYWILPAFLVSLGAGPAALGLIEGIAESVASFAKLFSGLLTDRIARRKPIVVAGYAVANAVKPVLALTTAWWQVLVVRFADRLAKGVRGAPRDVMIAESVSGQSVGSAFGLLQALDSAGAIAGPLLAVAILSAGHDMRVVFWAAVAPGALCIVVVTLFARETGHLPQRHRGTETELTEKEAVEQIAVRKNALGWDFYFLLGAVTLFSLGNSSDMFLILRAQDVGVGVRYAPLLGLVFNITYTAFSWPAGKLSDRMKRQHIAATGYVVFAVVYAVFAGAPSHAAIWAMMALYGAYYALTQPVLRALVVDTAPREARGRAFGVFYFATSLATLAASLVAGQLWKHFGPQITFGLSAALALVAAGMLLLAPKKS
ncbi:MAG: MFS transporter [Terriglobales bacterium]